MIKKLFFVSFMGAISLFAQTSPAKRSCGTMKHLASLKQQRPALEQELQEYNTVLNTWIAQHPAGKVSRSVRTIPVVFHIVYKTTEENISDEQILSQLKAMNEDFSRTNADASNTPTAFKSIAGNPNIQFCLAQRDPSGKPTTGIVRIKTTEDGFNDSDDGVKFKSMGGDDAWDVTQYYNIWICNFNDQGLLGYAEFPKGTASETFGYVGTYQFTGTTSNVKPPYNKGRTTTHEVGHTFNLFHIWGDDGGDCSGSDECDDTPDQGDSNGGKPTFPLTDNCTTTSPGVMFMNYMDYSDDDAMNMFTLDQVARIDAVLNNAPYNKLLTSTACSTVTGLEEESNLYELKVYPNPADGNFTLSFLTNEKLTCVIEIRNNLGQLFYTEKLTNVTGPYSQPIHIENAAKGVYTLSIQNSEQKLIKKLIIH